MVAGGNSEKIAWQSLLAIIGVVATMAYIFIKVGANENDVEGSKRRIERLEKYLDQVLVHNADTAAKLPEFERRINRLENKIDTSH